MSTRIIAPSFEALADLPDDQIKEIIARVGRDQLTIAMKAASEHFKDCFLGNMPPAQVQALTQHMEWLGPMRLSDVEAVQREIADKFRPDDNDDQFV
jgi:flagellar motor switch protein FliG